MTIDALNLLGAGDPISDIWLSGRPVDANVRAVAEAVAVPATGLPLATRQLAAIRAQVGAAFPGLGAYPRGPVTGPRLGLLLDNGV